MTLQVHTSVSAKIINKRRSNRCVCGYTRVHVDGSCNSGNMETARLSISGGMDGQKVVCPSGGNVTQLYEGTEAPWMDLEGTMVREGTDTKVYITQDSICVTCPKQAHLWRQRVDSWSPWAGDRE